ncbi:MAG: hypothetical protein IPN09_07770 [Bacteroidetes bacterium]|nr:hypothetical protein [Bacteroidota bacterium]
MIEIIQIDPIFSYMAVITRHKYATAHNNAGYLRQIGAVVDVPADKVDGSKPIMHSDQSTGTISINTNGGIYKALNDFNYLKM